MATATIIEVREAFRRAMANAGVPTRDEIVADGELHRVHVEGDKRGSKAGWYKLHADDPPAGAFGSWRSGVWETWCAKGNGTMTDAERAEWRAKVEESRRQQEEERQRAHAAARTRAAEDWADAGPANPDHPYLRRKGVQAHGLRQEDGELLVRVFGADGTLRGLQRIDADGNKLFDKGTEAKSGYYPIGTPEGTVVVAEGFATGASIREAAGHAVAVAFNAGNLEPVAQALRQKLGDEVTIVLAADNDTETEGNPGVAAATEAAEAVNGLLAVPAFEDDESGTDLNDLARLRGHEAVRDAIEAARPPGAPPEAEPVEVRELLTMELEPRTWIVPDLLQERDLMMAHAWRGLGKTKWAHGLAVAVASGGEFLKWRVPEPRSVLIVDGELPREDLQEYLAQAVAAAGAEPVAPLYVLSADLADAPVYSLATEAGREQIERHLDGVALLILDSVTTLCSGSGESENEDTSWDAMQSWLLELRRRGIAVLLIHHDGKALRQRGTSKREDVLNTSIQLRRPDDYRMDQGARFELHFKKARGLTGDAVVPFEAHLQPGPDGIDVWTWRTTEDATDKKAVELHDAGMSVRDIAKELGMSKSAVQRRISKATREEQ